MDLLISLRISCHSYKFLHTYNRNFYYLFWTGLKKSAIKYIATCQQHKYQVASPTRQLQPSALPRICFIRFTLEVAQVLTFWHIACSYWSVFKIWALYYTQAPLCSQTGGQNLHQIGCSTPQHATLNSKWLWPYFLNQIWTKFFKLQGTYLCVNSTYQQKLIDKLHLWISELKPTFIALL